MLERACTDHCSHFSSSLCRRSALCLVLCRIPTISPADVARYARPFASRSHVPTLASLYAIGRMVPFDGILGTSRSLLRIGNLTIDHVGCHDAGWQGMVAVP